MENMDFGKWYTKTINDKMVFLKFLSRTHSRILWTTKTTTITLDKGKPYLSNIVSCTDDGKDYVSHTKLRINKSDSGYYVNCKGIRCYCNSIIPQWLKEII